MNSRSLVFFCALALASCSRDENKEPRAKTDAVMTVTAPELIGKVRALGAKAVLVNAWATWCETCEHELPMLQSLADKFEARGVRVLLVSVDEPDAGAEVPGFLKEKSIRLPTFLAARPLGPFKAGMTPRWPGMLPATFLFDGTGKLRYFWGGEAFENEVVPIVEGLLEGIAIDGEKRFDVAPEAPRSR